jgi:HPt (histidine-containing phosphotransfer) domain-containing protein
MDDFLAKPVSPQDVAVILEEWLSGTTGDGKEQIVIKERTEDKDPVVLDRSALMERLSNNKQLYKMIMEMFLQKTPQALKELQKAIERGDHSEARLLSHNLKGTAANLGAEIFYDLSLDMEQLAKKGKLDGAEEKFEKIASCLPDLENEINDTIAEL